MNQANPVRTDLAHLRTEARNPRTLHIDTLPTPDMVRLMCEENRVVEDAVAAQADAIAAAIDIIAARLDAGGHLIYVRRRDIRAAGRGGCVRVPADLRCE